jgi:hypothetical protein
LEIEQAVGLILKAASGVTTITSQRIEPGIVPEQYATDAFITFEPDGDREHVQTLGGGIALVAQPIVVHSNARTFREAALLDAEVIDALDEFRGVVTNSLVSPEETLTVQGIFIDHPAHKWQYVDKTRMHEFVTRFICKFEEYRRLS